MADITDTAAPALPPAFAERLDRLLTPAQLQAWEAAFAAPPAAAFRVNPLRGDEAQTLAEVRAAGVEARRLDWPAEAWGVAAEQRRALTDCAAARQGRLYIQTPSSLVPVLVLDPHPGEEVLDLAAAPGGKTTHIAARMGNRGRIAAVESVKARFYRLRRNLERCGVTIADTYLADGTGVGRKVPARFDRVLLDAPCTSEGRFSAHDPDSYAYWSPKKVREMARKQKRLAIAAVEALKPGGVLVYCTCTLAPEENEAVLDALLRRYPDTLEIEALDLPASVAAPGLGQWEKKVYHPEVTRGARILPAGPLEAFFVARLRKRAA